MPTGIANVLSLDDLTQHYHVKLDTRYDKTFRCVNKKNPSNKIDFVPNAEGIPVLRPAKSYLAEIEQRKIANLASTTATTQTIDNDGPKIAGVMTAVTTARVAEGFTKKEVELAQQARRLQHVLHDPPDREFKCFFV